MIEVNHPLMQNNARQMLYSQGRLMGRLWACRDNKFAAAEVYALDGQAWIVSPTICCYLNWAEFCSITRLGQEWNVGPAGRVVASLPLI